MNILASGAPFTLMLSLALASVPALAVDTSETASPPELVACLSDDNSPFSSATDIGGGIDAEVSRSIGSFLHRPVRIVWITVPARGGLGKALRQSLKPGNCDLFMGVPVSGPANEDVLEQQLEVSEPYFSTGYVLVAAKGSSVKTLHDAQAAARVGVVTATPAELFLYRMHFNRTPYGSNRDLLKALSDGAVDAGLIWLPALADAKQRGFELWPGAIRDDHLQSPGLETHFVIAIRRSQPDLKPEIDAALAQMHADGFLASLIQRHGAMQMPWQQGPRFSKQN